MVIVADKRQCYGEEKEAPCLDDAQKVFAVNPRFAFSAAGSPTFQGPGEIHHSTRYFDAISYARNYFSEHDTSRLDWADFTRTFQDYFANMLRKLPFEMWPSTPTFHPPGSPAPVFVDLFFIYLQQNHPSLTQVNLLYEKKGMTNSLVQAGWIKYLKFAKEVEAFGDVQIANGIADQNNLAYAKYRQDPLIRKFLIDRASYNPLNTSQQEAILFAKRLLKITQDEEKTKRLKVSVSTKYDCAIINYTTGFRWITKAAKH